MEKFKPLAKILHCRRQWRHGQIPPLYVAFTLTHETLWNSLSEDKVSVNLRKVSWLGLLLVGGRTIREGGDQLCAGAGRHSIKGVQQQLPPIHQEQWTSQRTNFVPIYFGDRLLCRLCRQDKTVSFRYYWKVIWNLLEIHYWLVSSMTSSQFRIKSMSENIGRVVLPQLLFFF